MWVKKYDGNKKAKQLEARERLLDCAHREPGTALNGFDNSLSGYEDEKFVGHMRDKYGKNVITKAKKVSLPRRIFNAFINPFTGILIALAIIAFIAENDLIAVSIISTMVCISGLLRFIQESRSGKAAEKLTAMVKTTIATYRGSSQKPFEIPISELVVGDVIHLAAGDMVPADVRILKAKDFFISQSSLTGESEPVEKTSKESELQSKNPLDYDNLAFMGTNVIGGSAIAMVCTVGDDTFFGDVAQKVAAKKAPTGFEKGVKSVSWLLIRFMAIMAPTVLLINGFTKGDWPEAALFALAIAVGLTPEMLPLIVSANLAKGAMAMSRKHVIVKDLNSIQNFGGMDVLCTDKTGTITQDKIILEYHLDIHGKEDPRVLRHAFLNSHYQTGLKNLMDIAIVERAKELGLDGASERYDKLDEIPFDFNRRRMSVVVADKNGKTQLITKGAIEEMLSICADAEYNGKLEPMTDALRNEILTTVRRYNADGMRVLGVAHKNDPPSAGVFSTEDENGMTLIGYLAFLDPPKETAPEAVRTLKEHGVKVKVLTGDNDVVARSICKQVGIPTNSVILGSEIEEMDDAALADAVERTDVFAKLTPDQKARIVTALRNNGHTVGFMGDGINDAPAMRVADVGISVDTAVDIAKESANIILLQKDLMVLREGVIEGRKVYANTIKYIKMTASSNFGNMFSVLVASAFLPFLPMMPIHILALNLIYDITCIAIMWDRVDDDYLMEPKKWDATSIGKFMIWIGPTSSVFDITTYALMLFVICPAVVGGAFGSLVFESPEYWTFMAVFHAGWFVESLWTQTMVIHMIRTPKIPFIQSRASGALLAATACGIAFGTILPYTPIGEIMGLGHLPLIFFGYLALTMLGYMILVTIMKRVYIKRYGQLL